MLPVTSLYAALLAFMLLGLSLYVIRGRYKYQVSLEDGGQEALVRRIRAQGNFCEYAPFILLMMTMCELQNAMHPMLHALGLLLLIGRALHAYSLLVCEPGGKGFRFRMVGMILTFLALALAALYLLYAAIGMGLN